MIVQCENCRTKFNIDDALVKREGTKVRCSRCENVFLVFSHEQAEAQESATGLPVDAETDAEKDTLSDGPDLDLNFDASFEEDMMEDFEDLEDEYRKDPQGFSEQGDVDVSPEKSEDTPAGEPLQEEMAGPPAMDQEKRRKSRAPLILLVIVLGLIGIGFAVYRYAPHLIPGAILPEQKPTEPRRTVDMGASRLKILTVDGSFIDSQKTGRLFVISGKIRNGYPASRSFILIKGSILDDGAKVVKETKAFAGNMFKEEDLKSMSMAEVDAAMKNRPGIDKQNVNITPGTIMDFMIVFDNLPENMSEFTVEAVSSSPGDQEAEIQD